MKLKERNRNRRDKPRRTSYIVAEYRVREGNYRDILKNIGANGVFIKTQRTIAEGQPIELEFPLFRFEETIKAKGTVVRSGPSGFAVEFDQPIPGLVSQDGRISDIVHESDRL
ncbi:MAG: PilZ domain-containing protein [Desulfobacteraceae bacterium]|nr:MAG: PilZ domain-containing protein [Desulfobacteraceae bacterium]